MLHSPFSWAILIAQINKNTLFRAIFIDLKLGSKQNVQYLLNIGVWLKMSATSKLASILSSEQGQISCFEIEVFYLNQRRSKNPMYDEIKESIQSKGIQDPLHIVFHPVQKKWVLSQGGQTRLLICRELYDETKAESFLYPPVSKQKFTSDLDLCISHLVENNLRGDNTFLETANAVLNIRNLLAEGSEPTQELLAKEMSSRGMPIRRQSITAMMYLAEELAPYITNQAFLDCVSRKVVDSIRTLRNDLAEEMPSEKFDSALVEYVNSQPGNLSLKQIREHFLKKVVAPTTPGSRSNKAIAKSVSDAFGLSHVVSGSEELPSGFIVSLPQHVDSPLQAEVCFFLASLSGVFDSSVSREVLAAMGLKDIGSDPADLASCVREHLNLTNADLSSLPSRVFCHASEEGFESLIRLIAGIRASFNSNNQSMENQ